MRPETTNNEAELRAEIEELKRQLEHKHAGPSAAEHVVQPSRRTIRNLVLVFVAILIVAFVAGYIPRHRRDLQSEIRLRRLRRSCVSLHGHSRLLLRRQQAGRARSNRSRSSELDEIPSLHIAPPLPQI